MPVLTLETLEAWPEELRADVKKNEAGRFELNISQKAKVDEFRDRNIEVSKKLETAEATLAVFTPLLGEEKDPAKFAETFKELTTMAQRVKDGELSENTDIEAEVAKRTKTMREGFEAQNRTQAAALAAANSETSKATGLYKRSLIDQAITDAVMDAETGANPEALAYIRADAYSIFTVQEDGSLLPRNGDATLYGPDGTNPMTAKEWLTDHVKTKPLLAKRSAGGGQVDANMKDKYFGYTPEEFGKLTPMKKLELANKQADAKRG